MEKKDSTDQLVSNSYPTPDDIRKWYPSRGGQITRDSDPRERFLACVCDMGIEEHVIYNEAENPNPAGISASGFSDRLQGVWCFICSVYGRLLQTESDEGSENDFNYICLMFSDRIDMCELVALRIKKIHTHSVWVSLSVCECAWVCVLWACADVRVGLCSHTWFFLNSYLPYILRQNHSLNPELINSASLGIQWAPETTCLLLLSLVCNYWLHIHL